MNRGMDLSDFSMLDLFRMELENQLASMSHGLLEIEGKTVTMQELDSLMRAAHSIKGAARMVNVNAAVRISHCIEDSFVAAQKGRLRIKAAHVDILLAAVDFLQQMGTANDDAILNWHEIHAADMHKLEQTLSEMVVRNQDEGFLDLENELDRQLLKSENEKQENSKLQVDKGETESLRVDASRLSKIFSLAGESLVETHRFNKMLAELTHLKLSQHRLIEELDHMRTAMQLQNIGGNIKEQFNTIYSHAMLLRQNLSNRIVDLDALDRRNTSVVERLHREIMSTRMRPISSLVQPLPRLVRDLGRKLNKDVRLHMSGLATLVDREVLERIDSSLKHLVQNAADHGIELPDLRKQLGKPSAGNIYINVSQSAGMLFIVVHDDGGGVDIESLRTKVVAKGLASEEHLVSLSDDEVLQYLFEPGFSTRSKVSEISGRGVGLDLVKETVEGMNGNVFVASEPGHGTRFQLLLPQTVSIMRVLLSRIASESYGFPLSRIHRLLVIDSRYISKVENRIFFDSGQGLLELFHANMLLDKPLSLPLDKSALPIVVLEHDDRQIGLILESVRGEKELSIQRWDPDLGDVPGANSAAILDDGSLTLIVDTQFMRSAAFHIGDGYQPMLDWYEQVRDRPVKLKVLVYDVSRTARERLRRILQRTDFEVVLSGSLSEAGHFLESENFDLLVCGLDQGDEEAANFLRKRLAKNTNVVVLSDLEQGELEDWMPEVDYAVVYKSDFRPSQFVDAVKKQVRYDA